MVAKRQKRLTTEDVLAAVLASDVVTDCFSEDDTAGVCFVSDPFFRDSLLIDESDHDHDNNDYNDEGNAVIDPADDPSHNHDKFSSELDSSVPGPSHSPLLLLQK